MFNWLTKLFRSKERAALFAEANEARERSLAKAVAQAYVEKELETKVRPRDSKGRWLPDAPERGK